MSYDDLSNIYDLRIYSNLLLDFFDGLSLPVFTLETINKIAEAIEKGESKPQSFVPLMSRTEFQVISYFSHLMNICRFIDDSVSKFEEWYGHRVAISMLLLRKKFDKSFVKKRLLNLDSIDNSSVKILSKFIILLSKASDEEVKSAYENVHNTIRLKIVNISRVEPEASKTSAILQTPKESEKGPKDEVKALIGNSNVGVNKDE
jgi:hypothetical protein